jgi:hypothetical protein
LTKVALPAKVSAFLRGLYLHCGHAFISVPWKTAGQNDHIQPRYATAMLCKI